MDFREKTLLDPTVTHRIFQLVTKMSDDERRTLLDLLERGLLKGRCRRSYYRKRLRLPVAYAVQKNIHRNYTRDISLGGVFILTRDSFQAGEEIKIIFKSGSTESLIKLLGTVARVTPEGIGVRFTAMDDDKKAAILALAS